MVKLTSIEFRKPAFLCMTDLEKAFVRVRVSHVLKILQQLGVPIDIAKLIKEMYTNTSMRVKANDELSDNIPIPKGIRQGDSLNSILFSVVMD